MQEQAWWANDEKIENESKKPAKALRPSNGKGMIFGSAALIAALTTGLITATFFKPNPYAPHPSQFQSIEYPASVEAVITECGSIFRFDPPARHYGQFPEGFFDSERGPNTQERLVPEQPMSVPAYGYMSNESPQNFPDFIEPNAKEIPTKQQILRMMWDGMMIIWYLPASGAGADAKGINDAETINSIKRYVESNDNVIAVPWGNDRPLPQDRRIAFSMWNTTQSCKLWNSGVADEFQSTEKQLRQERPTLPPYAPLDEEGELFQITTRMNG